MLDPNCVFCKIAKGEIPAKKYYEDENFLAIFEINPISIGHLVVFSKNHYSNTGEMPEQEWQKMCNIARDLAEKHIKEINKNKIPTNLLTFNFIIFLLK